MTRVLVDIYKISVKDVVVLSQYRLQCDKISTALAACGKSDVCCQDGDSKPRYVSSQTDTSQCTFPLPGREPQFTWFFMRVLILLNNRYHYLFFGNPGRRVELRDHVDSSFITTSRDWRASKLWLEEEVSWDYHHWWKPDECSTDSCKAWANYSRQVNYDCNCMVSLSLRRPQVNIENRDCCCFLMFYMRLQGSIPQYS